MKYLIDIDAELSETLLNIIDRKEVGDFNEKTEDEKILFLKSILRKIKLYLKENPNIDIKRIEKKTEFSLGSYWRILADTLKIFSQENHIVNIGWTRKHGLVFQYFEKQGDDIFISYFSEGHPNKEFREKWTFRGHEKKWNLFKEMDVTQEVDDGRKAIAENFLPIHIDDLLKQADV